MSGKIVKATTWALSGQFVKLCLRFAVNIFLARLLTPKEFGLIGMVSVILLLLNSLSELGLFSSIIQKKDITQKDLSSVFWLSTILGFIVFIVLFAAAPLVVLFYHEESLLNVVRMLSLNFLFNSLALTHNAILNKELNFKRIETYSTISVALSSAIGLFMAYYQYGIWALVIQQNLNCFFNTTLIWIFEKWRPSFLISKKSLSELLGFGLKVFASAVLNTFFSSLDTVIIGRYFSASALGLYSFAQNLINIPITTFTSAFVRVLFPVMSEAQHDDERLKTTYKKAINIVNVIIIPGMGTVAVFASGIVTTLLNSKWLFMIPYVRFFAVISILYPLSALNINILLAKGRADKFLRLEILKKGLFVAGISIGLIFGIIGLLWGILISSIIGVFFNLYVSGKISNYSLQEQLTDLKPILILSSVYLIFLYCIYGFLSFWLPDLYSMFLSFIPAIILFLILLYKFQPGILLEIRTILHGFNKKNNDH